MQSGNQDKYLMNCLQSGSEALGVLHKHLCKLQHTVQQGNRTARAVRIRRGSRRGRHAYNEPERGARAMEREKDRVEREKRYNAYLRENPHIQKHVTDWNAA